jgi:hypothetical protein
VLDELFAELAQSSPDKQELILLITAQQDSSMLMSVTSLDLSGGYLGDKKTNFFKALFMMSNLTSLYLNGTGIGDDGVKALAAFTTLIHFTSWNLRNNNIWSQ